MQMVCTWRFTLLRPFINYHVQPVRIFVVDIYCLDLISTNYMS